MCCRVRLDYMNIFLYTVENIAYCWLALARQHTILVVLCVLGILCCVCGRSQILDVRFSACDVRFCIFLSRDTIHVILLRELPFVMGLREEAFLKVYWEICKPHLLLVLFNHCQNSVEN